MTTRPLGEMEPSRRWTTWVINPFHYVAGGPALAIGLAAIIVAGAVNWMTGSHFDGVLDFHAGATLPWWTHWVEGPVNWLIMSVLILAGGLLLSRSRIRPVDVFGTQALARFPSLIMALSVWPPPVQRANQQVIQSVLAMQTGAASGTNPSAGLLSAVGGLDLAMFGLALLIMLAMIVWMVILMYRAFAVSCNVAGGKAIGLFVVLVFVAEVISKIVLGFVYVAGGS